MYRARQISYRCSDRMCGAFDCSNCHPELQDSTPCPCCGELAPLWYRVEGDLCADCEDMEQCEDCGEWFKPNLNTTVCTACAAEMQQEVME